MVGSAGSPDWYHSLSLPGARARERLRNPKTRWIGRSTTMATDNKQAIAKIQKETGENTRWISKNGPKLQQFMNASADYVKRIEKAVDENTRWVNKNAPEIQKILNKAADRIKKLEARCDRLEKQIKK
jgi:uncharacterized protein Yka (UPF0111/DUF47 family)